jgi:hypothetical protein
MDQEPTYLRIRAKHLRQQAEQTEDYRLAALCRECADAFEAQADIIEEEATLH